MLAPLKRGRDGGQRSEVGRQRSGGRSRRSEDSVSDDRCQKSEDRRKIEGEKVGRLEDLWIKSNLRILNYKNFEELS